MFQSWFWRLRTATAVLVALFATGSAFAQHYTRTDLTVNAPSVSPSAPNVDVNLVNAWGLSRGSGSPWWVSDNGTGLTTLYDAAGVAQPLVVTIPAPEPGATSAPTGTVFNFTPGFEVAPAFPAIFMFATEDGTIAAWHPAVNLTAAVLKVKRQGKASYKGLAIAQTARGPRLYATNFVSGQIEVFNAKFVKVTMPATAFQDNALPPNFVPFNVQNVGGNLVVTFAHREAGEEDEDHGPGLGYVDIFDFQGNLLLRLQHGSFLNAPWGVAQAPGDFGAFSHRLLIGNFGDGRINVFNVVTGKFEGSFLAPDDTKLAIDGLWAISFGGNGRNGSATELYFTAGPNDESNGLFGKITPIAAEQRGNSE